MGSYRSFIEFQTLIQDKIPWMKYKIKEHNLQLAHKFCLSIYKFHNKPFTVKCHSVFTNVQKRIFLLPKEGLINEYPTILFEKDSPFKLAVFPLASGLKLRREHMAGKDILPKTKTFVWCDFDSHFLVVPTSDHSKKMDWRVQTLVHWKCTRYTNESWVNFLCKYLDRKGWSTMLTSVQSAGVTPEVNLRITQARKHTSEGSTLALKPRADVTQTGISVAPRKGLMSSIHFFKKLPTINLILGSLLPLIQESCLNFIHFVVDIWNILHGPLEGGFSLPPNEIYLF